MSAAMHLVILCVPNNTVLAEFWKDKEKQKLVPSLKESHSNVKENVNRYRVNEGSSQRGKATSTQGRI